MLLIVLLLGQSIAAQKEEPLKRMQPGDRLLYYSPNEGMRGGEPVQAFTAIGEILDRATRQESEVEGFSPFRRDVQYSKHGKRQ